MAKKAVKSTKTKVVSKPEIVEPAASVAMPATPVKKPVMNQKFLTLALIVVGFALLTYKAGPWLVPAVIGTRPVTRFEIWSRLEKSYGAQTLDDLVNEKILDAAIAKSGVKVDQAKVDEQFKNLETQFKDLGGLDQALTERGMTRANLEKQIRTQLSVEELLKDKINPSDEEVKKQYDDNSKTLYKDKKFDDVKASIVDELKQTKLRDAFLEWFGNVKKDFKVKNFGL